MLRSIVRGGRARGVATVLGIQTGLLLWITADVLGLAALLRGPAVVPTLLLFGAVFIALNLAYQFPLVVLPDRVSRIVSRPRVRRAMDAVTGTVLVGFGVRLATE